MPGVIVTTETRSGPASIQRGGSGRFFAAGLLGRGPAGKPMLVRSMAEFETIFGPRPGYGHLWDTMQVFFAEGGGEAYVQRLAGPGATTGSLELKNSAGTPVLRVSATSPGAWSTSISVEVAEGSLPDTYKLVVYVDGVKMQTFDYLDTVTEAVAATGRSTIVKVESMTAEAAENVPALAPRAPLSAGTDDRTAVTATMAADRLSMFGAELGTGLVALPGFPSALTGGALIAHAKATNRIALASPAQGATPLEAADEAAQLIGPEGEYMGVVYPWVRVSDGGSGTRTVPPEGFAAAKRAVAHRTKGPWRAPAGSVGKATFILGPEVEFTREQGDSLDEQHVSVIRNVQKTTRLYGWRSLSTDVRNYCHLTGRDTLNLLAVDGEKLLEEFVLETIDGRGQLLSRVASTLVGMVDPLRIAGGLHENVVDGELIDPGYSVDVGPTVNTVETLALNEIHAVLAVRVSPVGSLIRLTIVKAGMGAPVA